VLMPLSTMALFCIPRSGRTTQLGMSKGQKYNAAFKLR
jgi:hypothetical protein